jgi:hypothetical protein
MVSSITIWTQSTYVTDWQTERKEERLLVAIKFKALTPKKQNATDR